MWGQASANIDSLRNCGIIPMRVGTSFAFRTLPDSQGDHPHACGDKAVTQLYRSKDRGSSPCVWGQGAAGAAQRAVIRIIPMRVGTRTLGIFDSPHFGDHPHACGDKYLLITLGQQILGSSPCVWGQEIGGASTVKCDRIIPMRVGTRRSLHRDNAVFEDHPHACGDKIW